MIHFQLEMLNPAQIRKQSDTDYKRMVSDTLQKKNRVKRRILFHFSLGHGKCSYVLLATSGINVDSEEIQ